MDLNPKKYQNDKDKIFMDFFSLYGKNFIEQTKNGKDQDRIKMKQFRSGVNTTGNITPASKLFQ